MLNRNSKKYAKNQVLPSGGNDKQILVSKLISGAKVPMMKESIKLVQKCTFLFFQPTTLLRHLLVMHRLGRVVLRTSATGAFVPVIF